MTTLPNADIAYADPRKIVEYLLNLRHPDGASKAAFFQSFGFHPDDPEAMIGALLLHARSNCVTRLQKSEFGTSYVIEGPLETPWGRTPNVRTVWIIENGESAPRLVTAIPMRGSRS
ncbi:MAG: DUF6883 domain-containing protein [Rhodomicrobium sp.]